MNRYLYIAFLTIGLTNNSYVARAQNLVPNPGFELISTCNVAGLMDAMQNVISDWSTYDYSDNSPDIFNECFTYPVIQLPNSTFGYTYANSGTGCAGVGANPSTSDYREIISNQLTEPLVQDSAYCVSFFVKNSKAGGEIFSSGNFGLMFSNGVTNHTEVRQHSAHILPSAPVTGNEWTEVSGYFIASGGEDFVHIGYLGQPHQYNVQPGSTGVIYYFIDDVSVIQCNKDSLLSVVLELPNVITPNGDYVNDQLDIKQHNIKSMNVQILNRWGTVIAEYDGTKTSWDGNDKSGEPATDGVYFINVIAESTFGEMLSKHGFVHLFRNEH